MIASINFATTMMLALFVSTCQGFQSLTTQLQPLAARRDGTGIGAVLSTVPPPATTSRTATSLEMIFGRGNKNDDDGDALLPGKKMTVSRRKKLGVNDDEEEYDLEMALDNSTDPLITKIIAGSLIISIIALLVVGLVIPATTDYGDGVCNPLITGGRC